MKSFKNYVKNRDLNEMALPAMYDVKAQEKKESSERAASFLYQLDQACEHLDYFFDDKLNPKAKFIPNDIDNGNLGVTLKDISDTIIEIANLLGPIKSAINLELPFSNPIISLVNNIEYYMNKYKEMRQKYNFAHDLNSSSPNREKMQSMNNMFLAPAHRIMQKSKELFEDAVRIDPSIADSRDFKIINK